MQQAAQAAGKTPQAYCDELAVTWKSLAVKLGLSNDDFVRTTEPRHKEVVQAILSKLNACGAQFYKESCTRDFIRISKEETFLTEKDRLPDGTFPEVLRRGDEAVRGQLLFQTQGSPGVVD